MACADVRQVQVGNEAWGIWYEAGLKTAGNFFYFLCFGEEKRTIIISITIILNHLLPITAVPSIMVIHWSKNFTLRQIYTDFFFYFSFLAEICVNC